MSLRGQAYIAGAWEHPAREATGVSLAQLHAEVAAGALADAGLGFSDVDAYFCAGDAPGLGSFAMADYMGLDVTYTDNTETGGSSYLVHVGHAAAAIATGKARIALVTLAGKPRSRGRRRNAQPRRGGGANVPEAGFEFVYGLTAANLYGMAAMRHMHEFGTTSEQLAWIKVAASHHAQHNPNALLQNVVTVEEVLASPVVSDPLHRLDCCVVTDGGGALVIVAPEVARGLDRSCAKVLGQGEALKYVRGGRPDLTSSAAQASGPIAFEEAGVTPQDIKYVSIYDSFTITVLITLEDLGFCKKGEGGKFVVDGNLISGQGALPFNTDGGGLCSNHPGDRGGMTKVIEAVRQIRGEARGPVQVSNCDLALAHGTGGALSGRMGSSTLILGAEDA